MEKDSSMKLEDVSRLKNHKGRLIDDFTSFVRGTCFTLNGVQSMPMWAHYANNHKGFCVSYNVKEDLELNSSIILDLISHSYIKRLNRK